MSSDKKTARRAGDKSLESIQVANAPVRRQVTQTLRRAIEKGVLKPGYPLREKVLAEQLAVSRTALREAMRELESECLISYQGPRSIVVREISPEEALNIYNVREALETLVVGQFVERGDAADIEALQNANAELRAAYISADVDGIITAKAEFYRTLCEGAKNPVVMEILGRLNSRTSLLQSLSLSRAKRADSSIAEIQVLVDAIAAGDVEAARFAARIHIANAARAALSKVVDKPAATDQLIDQTGE